MTAPVPWKRYRSTQNTIEAVRWTGENWAEINLFGRSKVFIAEPVDNVPGDLYLIAGKNGATGPVPVPIGHWIAGNVGDWSDLWPIADEHFREKYDDAPPRACRECGCTDENACEGYLGETCHWIEYDLCSTHKETLL